MIRLTRNTSSNAFTLIEVIMSLALVAITVPTLLGTFWFFSKSSIEIQDQTDTQQIANVIRQHFESETLQRIGKRKDVFEEIYQSVLKTRNNPENSTILYVYLRADAPNIHFVTSDLPKPGDVSPLDGRIMAVEIQAPSESILPTTLLNQNPDSYTRPWLPYTLKIHATNQGDEPRDSGNYVNSIPAVFSR